MTGCPAVRVLVTGSRRVSPAEAEYVRARLSYVIGPVVATGQPVTVVQGQCHSGGVDLVAQRWADQTDGAASESHPADWSKGRSAGMIRNSAMVAAGADICIAFPRPDSRGTWHCIRQAADAGIQTLIYPLTRQTSDDPRTTP